LNNLEQIAEKGVSIRVAGGEVCAMRTRARAQVGVPEQFLNKFHKLLCLKDGRSSASAARLKPSHRFVSV
jgi:hypothetical protein